MKQVGVIPYKRTGIGKVKVLLVTSRETGRWVIPKGWRMSGIADPDAAAKEALEEAGVVGKVEQDPIGSYAYFKRRKSTFKLIQVSVYLLDTEKLMPDWQEKDERKRQWFSVPQAQQNVNEPGLITLLGMLR